MPVIQIHCSSVEAYLPWKCCCYVTWIAWDILFVMSSVTGNLCNKYPKWLVKQNNSYSDYFNAISGLHQTAEPQEALWHYRAPETQSIEHYSWVGQPQSIVDRAFTWSHTVSSEFQSHHCMLGGMWKRVDRLPCWRPRSQQVSHQRWILGNV